MSFDLAFWTDKPIKVGSEHFYVMATGSSWFKGMIAAAIVMFMAAVVLEIISAIVWALR